MEWLLLICRLALAAVFGAAGIAKLADLSGTRRTLREFGAPRSVDGAAGIVLPLLELTAGGLLLARETAIWGAWFGLTLLVMFTGAIAVQMARGRRPECRCFGQIHAEPVGISTLIRNAVLLIVAGAVATGGNVATQFGVADAAQIVLFEYSSVGLIILFTFLSVLQLWLLTHALRQNGRALARLANVEAALRSAGIALGEQHSIPVGRLRLDDPAPMFELPDLQGRRVSLNSLRDAGHPVLLLFSDVNCRSCDAMMPTIAAWQRKHLDLLTIAIIVRGSHDAVRAKATEHGCANVLVSREGEVAELYEIAVTPAAVLVRAVGSIGSEVAAGAAAIDELVTAVTQPAARIANRPLHIGEIAPAFRLPDADGNEVTQENFRGRSVLLMFWNPGCPFCVAMIPALRQWEARGNPDLGRLILVAAGTAAANRVTGLTSQILLDSQFVVGTLYRVTITPSAVLVNADGRIGSALAEGVENVSQLLEAEISKLEPSRFGAHG